MSSNNSLSKNKAAFKRNQSGVYQLQGKTKDSKAGSQWKNIKSTGNANKADVDGDNDTINCLICAEPLKFAALSQCNHTTCNVCAFRQRALYEKKACLVCRTENEYLIFTGNLEAKYSDFGDKDIVSTDEKHGVKFTSASAQEATEKLLKYHCPYGDLGTTELKNFKSYSAHLKDVHKRTICTICEEHKKVFPYELQIMSPNQLKAHNISGDKRGFKGHPLCGFCSGQRFYSDDELYIHMRERHEKCHICDQINPSQPQYFRNYDDLFEHFKHAHYVCTVRTCLDSKFVVFREDLDLQAHILKEHANLTGSKGYISVNWDRRYRSELSSNFSANISTAVFGQGSSSSATLGSSSAASQISPDMRQKRMEERARHYLNNSQESMQSFQQINNEYKSGTISATEVLKRYEQLFKDPNSDVFLLINNFAQTFPESSTRYRELNSIYETEQKRRDRILKFPSLSSNPWETAPVVGAGWGGNSSYKAGRASKHNFPSLSEVHPTTSSSSHSVKVKPSPSSLSKISSTPKSRHVVNTRPKANLVPNYLENRTNSAEIKKSSSNSALFPPLTTNTKKKTYKPVNDHLIIDPKTWGQLKDQQTANDETSSSEPNVGSSSDQNGKKRKQKRKEVLFHFGL
ncbi:HCL285Cp [Eremothecium sinecaudum]|uniref:RING-type E3 ubiquitin transferase n=1 Tax=Eremothecium sinecaudum TaxID=45286 RepID=A0A109UWI9_9SACH|nr:HCL285Cp [Eremothecium sinecaudum]AMD19866.1 HCL285Cp [Eremothecium sinecaudum]